MKKQSIYDQGGPVKRIRTGTRHSIDEKVFPDRQSSRKTDSYNDGKSAAKYQQRQQADVKRRQKVNPRLVLTDPDLYFDSQPEQLDAP